MTGYVRVSSDSVSPVQREKTTHVEELTFDVATLQALESAVSDLLGLAGGNPATMKLSSDAQGRSVLTATWETF